MKAKAIIDKLDFSGGQRSFFDFWHIHVDFRGDGNKDWTTRKKFMDEQLKAFEYLKTRLADYPRPFQLWVGVDEDDSSQDGVYIHTPNPNSDYFPHVVDNDETVIFKSSELRAYIEGTGLTVVKSKNMDSNYYFLFDKNIGTIIGSESTD
jgi:hypothetical protein